MTPASAAPGAPRTRSLRLCVAGLCVLSLTWPAAAQNYSFDARRIALGGTGGTPNVSSELVEPLRRYTAIVIPFGLIEVLTDLRVFYPNRDDFDFVKAVEYATRPLHFTFGRDREVGRRLLDDVAKSQANRDLNAYRGFTPARSIFAEGLTAPTFGKLFVLRRSERGVQGVYAGAGPYIAARAEAQFDAELVNLLGSASDRYLPSATFAVGGGEIDQLAVSFTGGYRARFPLPGRATVGTGRNGTYVAANYHYLYGLRLDAVGGALRLDTDLQGLLRQEPATPPLAFVWETSSSGHGFAVDFGTTFVVNRWEFGAGVSGLANRITWSKVTRHDVTLASLFGGSDFVHVKSPRPGETRRLELPVSYTTNVGYQRDKWSVLSEYAYGFQKYNFLTGFEYRWEAADLRAGARFSQGRWYPSAGVGVHLTRRWSVDIAAFGTKTFLEQQRRLAVALSVRLEGAGRSTAALPVQ